MLSKENDFLILDKFIKGTMLFSYLLQNDLTLHGRETAPNRELLDVFKCLWTYFRLGAQRDPAITSFATIYQPSR